MRPTLRSLLAAGLGGASLLLAACGGGGGSSSTPATATPDTADVQSVPASALPMSGDQQETGRALDVAIDGDGLLVGHDPDTGARVYTRWGRLDLDHEGYLVHAMGWRMGGVAADDAAALQGKDVSAHEAALPAVRWLLPARATSRVEVEMNTDSRSLLGSGAAPFDPADYGTYSHAASISVVDANRLLRTLTLYARRLTWDDCTEVYATVDGQPVRPQVGEAWHRLCYHPDGTQTNASRMAPPLVMQHRSPDEDGRPAPSLEGLQVVFDTTRMAVSFGMTGLDSDGYEAGYLTSVSVAGDGLVTAYYSNGVSVEHGRLVLARPALEDRYRRAGSVGWQCASPCATPSMAQPGQRLTGLLQTGWLATRY